MTRSPYPGAGSRRSGRRHPIVSRLAVDGVSMVPTLAPGDRVVALRWPRLEAGDLVAVVEPDSGGRILVKRVATLMAETIEVIGDNEGASRDSRTIGPISRRDVVGRVVYRYQPREAAGWFRRR